MIRANLLATLMLATAAAAWAAEPAHDNNRSTELAQLTLEELMQIDVTSVSKKAERLTGAPAAVYVLTGEEIRRSGVTAIPDALRLVPGMFVHNIDSNKYAVTPRDWPVRFANRLLVLIDGRTIYTPLFAGVFWEQHDLIFEDVDRIEVIRGPGATLWGANAVDGVINIITKSAKDTQGGLVTVGGGTEEKLFGQVRCGGRAGERAWYRIWAKSFDRDGFVDAAGNDANDDWSFSRAGFRVDWDTSDADTLTILGDYCDGRAGQTVLAMLPTAPFAMIVEHTNTITAGNVLARWARTRGDDSALALQVYYDWYELTEAVVTEERGTGDVDFQHRFRPSERHEFVWGLRYRITSDELGGPPITSWDPPERTDYLYSAFIQDEIMLKPDRLSLTVGSKFEHNDYTGFEYQPSARIAYTPSPRRTLWAAVSRAVRTPDRGSTDLNLTSLLDAAAGTFVRYTGSDDLEAEELLALEFGYRTQPADRVSFDVATYYHDLDGLISTSPGQPFVETDSGSAGTVIPLANVNAMDVSIYGIELAVNCSPTEHWRLRGGYAHMRYDINRKRVAIAPDRPLDELSAPNTAFVRSSADLGAGVQFDAVVRYVDQVPAIDIDSYVELDARLAWKPTAQLELFVVGRNLLDDHHAELTPQYFPVVPTEVERSVYAGVTWRF
jgi:iron complex outermembrane receptor protein